MNTVKPIRVSGTELSSGIRRLNGLEYPYQLLAKVNDTNVTLAISSVSDTHTFTLGWTGTLADGRIASASTWNSKQAGHANLTSLSSLSYSSTAFVKMTGANTFSLDTNTYLTGNQTITLSGAVTGSGATAITTTLTAISDRAKLPSAIAYEDEANVFQPSTDVVPIKLKWTSALHGSNMLEMVTHAESALFTVNYNGAITVGSYAGTSIPTTYTDAKVTAVSNSDGTLTISPTTGAVVASINLAHANTWTAEQTIGNTSVSSGLVLASASYTSIRLYNGQNNVLTTTGGITLAGNLVGQGNANQLGSTTVTGNLTLSGATGNTLVVDTSTLVVDATNNRVGIGTAAPSFPLHIYTTALAGDIRIEASKYPKVSWKVDSGAADTKAWQMYANWDGSSLNWGALNDAESAETLAITIVRSGYTISYVAVPNSNFGIGGSNFGTSASKVLSIKNGTAPSGAATTSTQLWSSTDGLNIAYSITNKWVIGDKFGAFNATAVAKQTGCAVPTDLATCIAAITALRTALNNYGLTTVV